jgi:hypothetical protein
VTPHQVAAAWQRRQATTLAQAYLSAWRTGQSAYRGQYATPPATAGQTTTQPATPSQAAMGRALAPALASLATMAIQLAAVIPTAAQLAAEGPAEAYKLAVRAFLAKRAWRLAAGISVIWAAEQRGYAQSAAADGLLLEWELDPTVEHHCLDCPALAALPPMPLDQWPTLPGEGATECSVGCHCSLRAVAAPRPVLTSAQLQVVSKVAARQHPPILVPA